MKYLKYPLYLLIGLILIFLVLCFLGPKDFNVKKSISIDAPSAIIFNLVNSVRETAQWNEWTLNDTTIVVSYGEKESGVGSSSSWTSEETGNGTQLIVESTPHKYVRNEMTFEGWDGKSYADIDINREGNLANVSWTFEGTPLPFWMRGMALIFNAKKAMHTNYEKGLENLKKIAEERADGLYNGYSIIETDIEEKHFVMKRQEVLSENIQQFYASNLGALFMKVQSAGIGMTGMPCGLIFKLEEGNNVIDMAAAIPIENAVSIPETGSYSIPERRGITLDFYGDYNLTSLGHNAIENFMHDRGYLQDPPIIEEYVTDPTTEKDPGKWLTKMTYYFTSQ